MFLVFRYLTVKENDGLRDILYNNNNNYIIIVNGDNVTNRTLLTGI